MILTVEIVVGKFQLEERGLVFVCLACLLLVLMNAQPFFSCEDVSPSKVGVGG